MAPEACDGGPSSQKHTHACTALTDGSFCASSVCEERLACCDSTHSTQAMAVASRRSTSSVSRRRRTVRSNAPPTLPATPHSGTRRLAPAAGCSGCQLPASWRTTRPCRPPDSRFSSPSKTVRRCCLVSICSSACSACMQCSAHAPAALVCFVSCSRTPPHVMSWKTTRRCWPPHSRSSSPSKTVRFGFLCCCGGPARPPSTTTSVPRLPRRLCVDCRLPLMLP